MYGVMAALTLYFTLYINALSMLLSVLPQSKGVKYKNLKGGK